MSKLTKSDKLVLKIHNEIDTAEERILKQCEEILSQNNIITEANLERKAKTMRELGFVNSETVKQYENLENQNKNFSKIKTLTKETVNYINELKTRYPLEKFITIDELERICTKYKLIHAPIANYIKDVPEKNILDMKKAKPLLDIDRKDSHFKLNGIKDNTLLKAIGHPNRIFTQQEIIDLLIKYYGRDEDSWTKKAARTTWLFVIGDRLNKAGKIRGFSSDMYEYKSVGEINYDGFYIAAPKTHFNLHGLTKKSKFGFFNVLTVTVPKDPIVFEYCKNGICRIITKWGTSDDQSYLDPALTNEIYN